MGGGGERLEPLGEIFIINDLVIVVVVLTIVFSCIARRAGIGQYTIH